MSERIVVDAYAWVEYLDGSTRGEKLRTILDEPDSEIYTCAVTLAEVTSKAIRTRRDHEVAARIIGGNSTIVDADETLSKSAGLLHAEAQREAGTFGLAHAYVLATARVMKARVLTGDPHFEGYPESIMI